MMTGKATIYALIALGFVCLIGAQFVGRIAPDPNADATLLASFFLVAAGTAAFVFAGIMAMRTLRGGGRR
jgi:hypothetical protein